LKDGVIADSLFNLTHFLFEHFKTRPFILVDEYDAVINEAYLYNREVERKKIVSLFSRMYRSAFNQNNFLGKALVVGTYRLV
jgi:hypothetical protein